MYVAKAAPIMIAGPLALAVLTTYQEIEKNARTMTSPRPAPKKPGEPDSTVKRTTSATPTTSVGIAAPRRIGVSCACIEASGQPVGGGVWAARENYHKVLGLGQPEGGRRQQRPGR